MSHRGRPHKSSLHAFQNHAYVTALQHEIIDAYKQAGKPVPDLVGNPAKAPGETDGIYGNHTSGALHALPREEQDRLLKQAGANRHKYEQTVPQQPAAATTKPLALPAAAAPPPSPSAQTKPAPMDADAFPRPPQSIPPTPMHAGIDGQTAIFDYKTNSLILPAQFSNRQLAAVSGKNIEKTVTKNGKEVVQQIYGRNNPAMESASRLGPVPEGLWNLGAARQHNFHMADKNNPQEHRPGISMTPAKGTNPQGRDGIVIHEAHGDHTIGCIGLSKEGMNMMIVAREQGVTKVLVTRDASALGYNVATLAPPHGTANYQNGWVDDAPKSRVARSPGAAQPQVTAGL